MSIFVWVFFVEMNLVGNENFSIVISVLWSRHLIRQIQFCSSRARARVGSIIATTLYESFFLFHIMF